MTPLQVKRRVIDLSSVTKMIASEIQTTGNHPVVHIPQEVAEDHPVIPVRRKDH